MRTSTGMEALLRPPIELWSALMALVVVVIALISPWALMMPRALGLVVAAIAAWFGWTRLKQALAVIRYQHGIKFYHVTRVAPSKLPGTRGELYLGDGFKWTQLHTQRKIDAIQPDAKPFVQPSAGSLALRSVGTRWTRCAALPQATPMAHALGALARFDSWANPFCSYPDLGGSAILHGVGSMDEAPVMLRDSSRMGHLLVMGTTRVGKTRMLELLATQDIRAGRVTVVIDPKGDADLMLRIYAEAKRADRDKEFYLFHLGYPEISARYNGIGNFGRITEVATRATNALPSTGNSAAFKEFSWRFSNIVAQAQVALGRVPTYETLLKDVSGVDDLFMDYAQMVFRQRAAAGEYADWEQRVASLEAALLDRGSGISVPRQLKDRKPELVAMFLWVKDSRINDKVLSGLAAAFSYERSFYEKIIASLGPFLEKLTTGAVGKLISPDYFDAADHRPIFDWMTVIRQRGIVYVGLDALSDAVVSGAVGNSMLADLVSVGGKLYKSGLDPHDPEGRITLPDVACHFDEVNEIAGPEFVPMVNKLGGAGFKISAYTQSLFDIEAKVGDRAKAGQILDNFNHIVMLRVRSVTTANLIAEQTQQVDVMTLTPMSGVTDTAAQGNGVDFVSRNDDIITKTKVPMIEAADVLELPQGQAFALLEGNRAYKIRIPLPDSAGDAFIPESLKKVASDMRARYRTSERWAEETDWMGTVNLNGATGAAAGLGRGTIDIGLAGDGDGLDAPPPQEDSLTALTRHPAILSQVMGGAA